jgi:hypothetical protein
MEPSIGEAISLQGQTNYTQKLAAAAGRIGEAERARKLKLDIAGAKAQQGQGDDLMALFKNKANYHPKVLNEVEELLGMTLQEAQKINSSTSPSRSNDIFALTARVRGKISELESVSTGLYSFDKQIKDLGTQKKFAGEKIIPFLEKYKNANRKELIEFAKTNPFGSDRYLQMSEDGLPQLTTQEAIPYNKDLQILVGNLQPVIFGEDVVSIPDAYGQKELQRVQVRPIFDADAKNAYDKNTSAFPQGQPVSIEKIVKNYLQVNYDAYEQIAADMNLNITPQADGTYSLADTQTIETALIKNLAAFANPELKGKILSKPSQTNISVNSAKLAAPQGPTKELETVNYGLGDTGEDQKISSYEKMDIGTPDVNVPRSDQVRDAYGNQLAGELRQASLDRVRILPYKLVKGSGGNKIKVKANAQDVGSVVGVYPFVEFSQGGKIIYTPLSNYSNPSIFAGSKYDAALFAPIFTKMLSDATTVTQKIKDSGKKFKSVAELNNFVTPLIR